MGGRWTLDKPPKKPGFSARLPGSRSWETVSLFWEHPGGYLVQPFSGFSMVRGLGDRKKFVERGF